MLTKTPHLITVPELQAFLAKDPGKVLICDCRYDLVDSELGKRAYDAGHIPGAIYINLGKVLSSASNGSNGRHPLPDPDRLAADLAALGVNADTLIVAYDAPGGSYAARLWWCARWVGHAQVVVLDGTIDAWTKAGLALSIETPAPRAAGNFKRGASLTKSVSYADVRAGLGRADRLIIDGRPEDRFQGLNETLDPKAGHIPGALSRFSKHNLDENFCFKSPEVLKAEFLTLFGEHTPQEVVASCGSGVSACHLLLAMELAGLKGAALYGGSWSEWCAQADAPVETGPSRKSA
ncbi:sulfurtransferase [Zwartia vadi]|uniref:sulfurtransferase n=1 Tax=Zwartia vadi TaxID=3058168 RepID=UPI0025B42409|nr:sulfurtransferase [Zwartia vadi]MDN3986437.1 sulfurtransferase [Zwartia vadi]